MTIGRARTRSRRGKPRHHRGSLREELTERGAEIIENGGISALTLRSLAEATGVSRQAPYHHFGDKDGLLAAIATAGFEQLARAMSREAARNAAPEERLVALGVTYVTVARAAPQRFDLCSGTYIRDFSAHPALTKAREEARAILDRAVVELLGTGEADGSTAAEAGAAWAMAHGLARLLLEQGLRSGRDGLPSEKVFVREAFRLLVRGMCASRSTR